MKVQYSLPPGVFLAPAMANLRRKQHLGFPSRKSTIVTMFGQILTAIHKANRVNTALFQDLLKSFPELSKVASQRRGNSPHTELRISQASPDSINFFP